MKKVYIMKKIFGVVVLMFLCGWVQSQSTTNPPVAYWSMSGSDSIVPGQIGDHQGVLRHYTEGQETFVDAKVGKGTNFDGVKNIMYVADSIDWMKSGNFSISFWMYLDILETVPDVYSITVGGYQAPNSFAIRMQLVDNKWYRIYSWDKALNERRIERRNRGDWTHILNPGWTYLTVVSDNSVEGGLFSFYIDGVVAGTVAGIHEGTDQGLPITFGGYPTTETKHFKGIFDEVRIFDYALTETEVKALKDLTTHAPMLTREYKLVNYPNPVNSETTISYSLLKAGKVTLDVFNNSGQKIKVLVNNEQQDLNSYQKKWDCRNESGELQPSGMYFYRLRVNDETVGVGKIMLVLEQ